MPQSANQRNTQQYIPLANDLPDPLGLWGHESTPFNEPMPEVNPYAATYDPNTMSMTKNLESLYPQYNRGFNQFREEALRSGPSKWLRMSQTQNDLRQRDSKERGKLEIAANTAGAKNALAASGGLTSGARERASEQGQKNFMSMAQDVGRQDSIADIGMTIQDESNRVGQLAQLPGMEMTHLKEWEGAKEKDINNTMQEQQRLNQYNMDLYKTRMETWAASKQANATENSGKGGGK